jgi:hypothetical protein
MLLSGYLDEEKPILADPRTLSAKFFLFQEGKFWEPPEEFAREQKVSRVRHSATLETLKL